MNIRALLAHDLSDALVSVAVIVAGALIVLHDMTRVDPAIAIGIAACILCPGVTGIGGPIRTLMLGSPPDIDGDAVVAAVRGVDGVADIDRLPSPADAGERGGARPPGRRQRAGPGSPRGHRAGDKAAP